MWTTYYGGIPSNKGSKAKIKVSCGRMATKILVDKKLYDDSKDKDAVLEDEIRANITGMKNELASALVYGKLADNPLGINGLFKHYSAYGSETADDTESAHYVFNALARYQIDQFKARQQERYADNKRMHDAAVQKYSKADFEQINAGIDFAFAKDGVMNYIVRNSEIGNDPEFLELMKWYGAHHPTDRQPAGSGSGGGTTGQPAGFNGIAQSWK